MNSNEALEQRITALEREVAEIRLRIGDKSTNGNWVDEIAGSMKSFPEFDEVVRLGREFRDSQSDVAS